MFTIELNKSAKIISKLIQAKESDKAIDKFTSTVRKHKISGERELKDFASLCGFDIAYSVKRIEN